MSGSSVAGAAAAVGIAPLTMRLRSASGEIVGRATELAAVQAEVARAQRGELAAVALEGEPGIGKSHLLVAAGRLAAERGFVTVAAGADEELRGPFLLARSIFGNAAAQHGDGAGAGELRRVLAAMTGLDEPEVAGLSPDEKLLRVFDLGAVAVRTLAGHAPLALVLDDLQWADDDSVRMLRYITRSLPGAPLFVALAIRPEEAAITEAAPLLADLERLGVLRRLRLSRMTQAESADLLRGGLGGGG
jgi:predicted ATPase